jgi:BirA family transcriptional regulator, biotin operon repressor / biotin---[acetyl-CoA-carboxylase] ligase
MLKWPNDLYIDGRKVAGILVESSLGENPFAVAGIGLNVNHESFPPPLDETAISLRIATGQVIDRNALAAALLNSISNVLPIISTDFDAVLKWAAACDFLLHRTVAATLGNSEICGIAYGLDSEGALIIRTNDGALLRLNSGEVTRFQTT